MDEPSALKILYLGSCHSWALRPPWLPYGCIGHRHTFRANFARTSSVFTGSRVLTCIGLRAALVRGHR